MTKYIGLTPEERKKQYQANHLAWSRRRTVEKRKEDLRGLCEEVLYRFAHHETLDTIIDDLANNDRVTIYGYKNIDKHLLDEKYSQSVTYVDDDFCIGRELQQSIAKKIQEDIDNGALD